ncbi:MAG TPA: NAD(P)-binding domain-containing protein, partial [Pirellulaceae bacterium]
DVGGNWYYGSCHSSVYGSTHLISSKRLTEYVDFAMPGDYPEYPHHSQALAYLRAYAQTFGLYSRIQFHTSVERIERVPEGFVVSAADGSRALYRGVVIANGHHSEPRWPNYPGEFTGTTVHAHHYKVPDILRDRRVLVVGAGNSGCDIAVESALHARSTHLSLRRGYYFVPKFLCGKPVDRLQETLVQLRLPPWLHRLVAERLVHLAVGSPEAYGLPRPDHHLFETHPIVNTLLPHFAGHGRIHVKPDVARFDGQCVHFQDGSSAEIDVVILATGYRIHFPFLDPRLLNTEGECPRLFLNVFSPVDDRIFVAGLIQPDGGLWRLADLQSKLIARFLRADESRSASANWFRRLKRHAGNSHPTRNYVASTRHLIEVDYFDYRRRIECLLAEFER